MTVIHDAIAEVSPDAGEQSRELADRNGKLLRDLAARNNGSETAAPPRRSTVLTELAVHRSELQSLGIEHLWLVGSVARDDAIPASDIDLVLQFGAGRMPDLFTLSELQIRIEEWFANRYEVDVAIWSSLKPSIAKNMACDQVEIF